MPPIVALVGRPDSGKTTLLERLIPELARRGCRVGTIKHHHLPDFSFDVPGKDSWRHRQAGAAVVVLAAAGGIGLVAETLGDPAPEDLAARYFSDVDLVIAEGYKQIDLPKIEVHRRAIHPQPLDASTVNRIALVSDVPDLTGVAPALPCFSLDDVAAVAVFLLEKVVRPWRGRQGDAVASLCVDGRTVPLNGFVRSFLAHSVMGMVRALKGCEQPGDIVLNISSGRGGDGR